MLAPHSNAATNARTTAIEVRDLHKSYGSLEVLKGISVAAQDGEVIAIIGGSGSGKSTFLRCINLLEQPNSGQILIGGEEVKLKKTPTGLEPGDRKQVERIRTNLAMVFQSFNLWQHMDILHNVIEVPVHVLGQPRDQAIVTAEDMLRRVGLYEKRHAYPSFLSGGQQQRAAIARALAVEPSAMLFDEPTSALDPELVGEVLKVIKDIASEGRTMMLVTHEMAFAREVADRVIFLHQGRIEEQGPSDQIFSNPRSERLQQFLRSIG
ncbi:ABC transporter ATP-binding protein [Thalassobius sp. Cn5-15]|uniref:ABC transporter ATP-binding protein n=1 Tax=Thalassobius sp. Cn5-15 TaxID=2917763 RepID=UPI001EF190DA|nr:ATP-binding cassette domain-containing protein [Thalassobius sp. Cn5-15]MCG7493049.1 ATP-binding cassette domain-containing protein [Thalassobius sp. Cn5-15]